VPSGGGTRTEAAAEPEPDVGWYASKPAGYSAAPGPYATAGPYAASPYAAGPYAAGGKPGGMRGSPVGRVVTWGSGRSKLLNAAIFGVAPLALAGIVAAAFVLSSAGRGQAAAQTGFHAGPGASVAGQPQGAGSTSAGAPSPSQGHPSGQHKPKSKGKGASIMPTIGAKAPSSHPKPRPKSSPKPKPKPAAVTPHNLGVPNIAGYCQHIGMGTAVTTANNAYGWHCSLNTALTLSIQNACGWTFGLSAGAVINVSTDFNSLNSWQCWRTNGILGQLNLTAYCTAAGLGAAKLSVANAYGWSCAGTGIDTNAACQLLYHNNSAFSRFAVFSNPYSWQCWH